LGAAVYSQAGEPCPPRFAFGFAWRSHAIAKVKACPAQPEGREDGTTGRSPTERLTARNHTNFPNRHPRPRPRGRGSRRNSRASG
jgi:hypothetical protein